MQYFHFLVRLGLYHLYPQLMADFQFNLRELWILLTDRTPPVIWAEVRRQFPANDVTQGRNLFAHN